MTTIASITEPLTKAEHDLMFAVEALRDALHHADRVQSILLLPMIGEASNLLNRVRELRIAL